jgi:hypothetical protein
MVPTVRPDEAWREWESVLLIRYLGLDTVQSRFCGREKSVRISRRVRRAVARQQTFVVPDVELDDFRVTHHGGILLDVGR